MKKIAKIAAIVTLAATSVAGFGAAAGCGSGAKTGEAYALVHGGGYVGYAKITTSGTTVSDLALVEVCLPDQVKAGDSVAAEDKVGNLYKCVSYGSVSLTYDGAAKDYVVDGKGVALKEYLRSFTNCKAYYEAVTSNAISVKVGGEQKTDIMNNSTLNKEENGYWSTATTVGSSKVEGDSKWVANRDATVKYVKENGTSKLKSLTQNESGYWTDGTVVTGATWTDLNKADKGGKIYSTYAELILEAEKRAK